MRNAGGTANGRRREVASYGTYAEARGVVDCLSDRGFSVERVSIVARGLSFEERVMGGKGLGRAALEGLGAGALPGALVGFVFGLFGLVDPLVSDLALLLWGLVFGGFLGAVFGLVSHASSGGGRNSSSSSSSSSVGAMRADRYDVVADEPVAEGAARRLCERRWGRIS